MNDSSATRAPRATVVLGPLPVRAAHFVAPLPLALIGAGFVLGALNIMTREQPTPVISILGALLAAGLFVATAIVWTRRALLRRRAFTIVVTPDALERGAETTPRVEGEVVRAVKISGIRDFYQMWSLEYGDGASGVRVGEWLSFRPVGELEPIADTLRFALATTPRGAWPPDRTPGA